MRGQVLGKNIFIHRGTRSDNIIISVKKPTPNGAKRPTPNKNLCAKCGIYPSKSIYLIFLYLIFLFPCSPGWSGADQGRASEKIVLGFVSWINGFCSWILSVIFLFILFKTGAAKKYARPLCTFVIRILSKITRANYYYKQMNQFNLIFIINKSI